MARSTLRIVRLLPMLALLCSAGPLSAEAPKPVLTTTQVRIDVDASGRVTAVEPTSPLPAPLSTAIREHVRGWRFEAPVHEGQAVPGTTYARMSVCAAAAGDQLAFTVGKPQNGPGVDARMLGSFFFPSMSSIVLQHERIEMDVVYEVQPDGRADVVSLTTVPDRAALRRELDVAFRKWFAPMRFEPERVGGQAVATRMRMPWTFTMERVSRRPTDRELERRRVESDASCQALLGKDSPDGRAVAVDSPFRLQPSG